MLSQQVTNHLQSAFSSPRDVDFSILLEIIYPIVTATDGMPRQDFTVSYVLDDYTNFITFTIQVWGFQCSISTPLALEVAKIRRNKGKLGEMGQLNQLQGSSRTFFVWIAKAGVFLALCSSLSEEKLLATLLTFSSQSLVVSLPVNRRYSWANSICLQYLCPRWALENCDANEQNGRVGSLCWWSRMARIALWIHRNNSLANYKVCWLPWMQHSWL